MWTFTTDSFTSAVYKDGKFQIRARDKQSLLNLGFKSRRIKSGRGTDYPFRVYATHEEYANIMYDRIMAIDYSNFKNEAHFARPGKNDNYARALHRVWDAMLLIEPANVASLMGKNSWRFPTRRKGSLDAWSTRFGSTSTGSSWVNYRDTDQQKQDDRDVPELEVDVEYDAVLEELDKLPESMHDWTEAEWDAFMRENPSGV